MSYTAIDAAADGMKDQMRAAARQAQSDGFTLYCGECGCEIDDPRYTLCEACDVDDE